MLKGSASRSCCWPLAGIAAALAGAASAAPPSTAEGIAAFETVKQVLQHPRCQTAHPRRRAAAVRRRRPHAQNVMRGPTGNGAMGRPAGRARAAQPAGELRPARPSRRAHLAPAAARPQDGLHRPVERRPLPSLEGREGQRRQGPRRPRQAPRQRQAGPLGLDSRPRRARQVSVPHDELIAAFRRWKDAGAPCPAQ